MKAANRLRRLWSLYQQNSDLIQVGAYQPGSNADLDAAIALRPEIEQFLQQDMHDPCSLDDTRQALLALYQRSMQFAGTGEMAPAKAAPIPAATRAQNPIKQTVPAGRAQGQPASSARQPIAASGVRVQNRFGKG